MWYVVAVCSCLLAAASHGEECYYARLGLPRQATQHEVRQAYKKLAVKLHPDKNPDETLREKFMKITEAYESLKDPEKRRRYDLYGTNPSYERRYDSHSQAEYNKLYYQGLYNGDENVENLSGKDYNSFFTEDLHFINFYSPFCPPCQEISEHWKTLAQLYKGIIRVGAVNCKLHNSFCYNSIRINSYPTLLFYPHGSSERWVRYTGARSLVALEQFVLPHVRVRIAAPPPPLAAAPALHVRAQWDDAALLRLAYHLDGVVPVYRADVAAHAALDDDVTAWLRLEGDVTSWLRPAHEAELLAQVAEALPAATAAAAASVDADRLREIRNSLRTGSAQKPVVLFFTKEGDSVLPLHKARKRYGDQLSFGRVECSLVSELCLSLGAASTPAWGMLKLGGAWQRGVGGGGGGALAGLVRAAALRRLHSLSEAEAERVLAGEDPGVWLVAVVPASVSAGAVVDAVTQSAQHFADDERVHFGFVECVSDSSGLCRRGSSLVVLQQGEQRLVHSGDVDVDSFVRLVQLALDSALVDLKEQDLASVLDPSSRSHAWLVAFLPARCVACAHIDLEWRTVAERLATEDDLKVARLDCARRNVPLCANVRSPTMRLLLPGEANAHNANLESLGQAPYMLEWALSRFVPTTQLYTDTFDREVSGERSRWLVYFHSPRCFHCYSQYWVFALAARRLADAPGAVRPARVDCVAERALCRRERVAQYPELRLYGARAAPAQVPLRDPAGSAAVVRALLERPARDEL